MWLALASGVIVGAVGIGVLAMPQHHSVARVCETSEMAPPPPSITFSPAGMGSDDRPIDVPATGLDVHIVAMERRGTKVRRTTFEIATSTASSPGPAVWHWSDPH